MQRHALIVADAERVDLGTRAGAADEGVVLRNRSVGVDAQDLAHEAVELLRLRPVHRVDADARGNARRHEQRPVAGLNRPAADALGVEDGFHVLEAGRVVRQPRPRHHQHAGKPRRARGISALGERGVREVDDAVPGEVAIREHLEQSLRPPVPDRRQARERLRRLAVLADDADPARALADDDAAIRQEVECERAGEAAGHGLDRHMPRCGPDAAPGSVRATREWARSHRAQCCRPAARSAPAPAAVESRAASVRSASRSWRERRRRKRVGAWAGL